MRGITTTALGSVVIGEDFDLLGEPLADRADQLQQTALEDFAGAELALLIQPAHTDQQGLDLTEVGFIKNEIQAFLKAKRRQLRRQRDRHVLQIQRIALQLRQQKGLGEVDQQKIASVRVRNQVQFVRQDKRQGMTRERPDHAADVLHGVSAQIDLNLKILMPMRPGFGAAGMLVTDVEIGPLAALLHAIGRRWRC